MFHESQAMKREIKNLLFFSLDNLQRDSLYD
jgi:hypothetical protein